MLALLTTIMNRLCRLIEYILAALLTAMVSIIFLQVFCRFVLSTGFAWSEELARFLFVWMSMLAAAVAVYRKENLGIEFVVNMLPPGAQKICRVGVEIGCLVLFSHIVWYAWKILPIVGRQTSPALLISMTIPYASILASSLLMCLATVISLIRVVQSPSLTPGPPTLSHAPDRLAQTANAHATVSSAQGGRS